MPNTIHLRTSIDFIKRQNDNHSQLIIEKFKESCLKLDASIFEPFMEDDTIFEDKEKYVFLADMKKIFDLSRLKAGRKFDVRMSYEKCLGCSAGQPVHRFDVYKNDVMIDDFGFLMSLENRTLKDIYQCSLYREREGRWVKPEGLPAIYLDYNQFIKK